MPWYIWVGILAIIVLINYIYNQSKEKESLEAKNKELVAATKIALDNPENAKLALLSTSEDEYAKRIFYRDSIRTYLIAVRSSDYHNENKDNTFKYTETRELKSDFDAEFEEFVCKWRSPGFQQDYDLVINTLEDAPLEQFLKAYSVGRSLCLDIVENTA